MILRLLDVMIFVKVVLLFISGPILEVMGIGGNKVMTRDR
jgi:hypothetical protein